MVVTLHPRAEGEVRRLEALVDTGAGYTVVPRPVLEALGCEPHRLQPVRFADGRVEEWPVAEVEVECEGRRATRFSSLRLASARTQETCGRDHASPK